jgi:phosphate starvation-inducible PhoH-like protein
MRRQDEPLEAAGDEAPLFIAQQGEIETPFLTTTFTLAAQKALISPEGHGSLSRLEFIRQPRGNFLDRSNSGGKFAADDHRLANLLFGPHNRHLKYIERALGVRIGSRGNELHVEGDPPQVDLALRLLEELYVLLQEGYHLYPTDVDYALRILSADSKASLKGIFLDTIFISARNKIISPKSLAQKTYIDAIRGQDVVFGIGPAGTGKTYLAMAMAVSFLMKKEVSRIVLVRPAVEAGEKLGFLPGDIAEKVNPYLRPLYDALFDMMDFEKGQPLIEKGVVEVAPLAFMRGRTLNDAFVILDEAQNTTAEQMKMFLTRLGFGSRAVITGDITQVDLPAGRPSGLVQAVDVLKGIEGIHFNFFTDRDVVRHPIVQTIVKAYERAGRRPAAASLPMQEDRR